MPHNDGSGKTSDVVAIASEYRNKLVPVLGRGHHLLPPYTYKNHDCLYTMDHFLNEDLP